MNSPTLAESIAKTVAEWPPLSQAQLARLAILFRGEGSEPPAPTGADALAEMMGEGD